MDWKNRRLVNRYLPFGEGNITGVKLYSCLLDSETLRQIEFEADLNEIPLTAIEGFRHLGYWKKKKREEEEKEN